MEPVYRASLSSCKIKINIHLITYIMKQILFALLLFPFITNAQERSSKFENDTLYTSSGYKIFVGQKLEFNQGIQRDNRFRYVTIKNGYLSSTLANNTVVVKEITQITTTALGNGYIELKGYITLKDGSREIIILKMSFDKVIENSPDLPSELKVPDEFRNKFKRNIKAELTTAKNLYEDKVINKVAYNELKEKLEKQL
jgi:hypothetical protein